MNAFYKGRTNNHLSWVMVDATDFATPESALSAATKIKIYGKLRGGTGVNFVSSGTGSLTNDIQHVGASALGIYTIALAKADLSDASAAWYDQYIISLSATGAAYQTLVVDGGIDASAILALSDAVSNAYSAAVQANSRVLLVLSQVSDAYSQLSDFRSDLASFLTTTGVNLNASAFSDIRSAIAAGPAATVTASDISDIASAVWANAIGARVDSRVLLNQSRISDVQSYLVAMSGMLSDVHSGVSDIQSKAGASPTASDIASAVNVELGSRLSDILSAAVQVNSRALVIQSMVSDTYSQLSDFRSDLGSLVTTTGVQLNASSLSDLRSAIAAVTATLSASDISDIASAVWANTIGARVDSRVLLNQSRISDVQSYLVAMSGLESDIYSQLSDFRSDLASLITTTGVQLNASSLSDLRSAITAGATGLDASALSDIASAVVAAIGAAGVELGASSMSDIRSMISDVKSAVTVTQSLASDAHSAAAQGSSRALVVQSMVSDTQSKLSDVESNLLSFLTTTGVNLNASALSDLRSAITAGATGLDASALSDIASAVVAAIGAAGVELGASSMSDLRSMVSDVKSAVAVGNSRVLLNQSRISDLQSALAAGVSLDASTMSDLRSAIDAGGGASVLSDILSAAQQVNSRVLVNQSRISDIYSLVSDLHSDLGVLSGVVSDTYSAIQAGVEVGASSLSDLRSAITANGVLRAGADPTTVVGVTDTLAAKVDWITALSRNRIEQTAALQRVKNDANNDTIASAVVSDDATTFVRDEYA